MSRKKKIILTASGIFAVSLLLCNTIPSAFIKPWLTEEIRRTTGRKTSLQSLGFNPLTLTVSANELLMDEQGGGRFIRIGGIRASFSPLSIFKRALIISEVAIDDPAIVITRTSPDTYNFTDILRRFQADNTSKSSGDTHFSINRIRIQGGSIDFTDHTVVAGAGARSGAIPAGEGFRMAVSDIAVSLKNVTNTPNTPVEYELSLLVDREASLRSKGSFSTSPLSLKSSLSLQGVKLYKGWPYLARYLTAPVNGVMNLSGDMTYTGENGLTAGHANLTLKDLSARYGSNDGFDLALFSINGASFNWKENRLDIGEVTLSKGSVSFSREPGGGISLLSLIKTAENAPHAPERNRTCSTARPFSYCLKRLRTDGLSIAFTDKTLRAKPRFTLRDTALVLANLNGPEPTPATLRCSATFGDNTLFRASGDVTPLPFRYRGALDVERLDVRDFKAYFSGNENVRIGGGYLDTSLKVDIGVNKGKPEGAFRGNAGIRAFHAMDPVTKRDLLKWKNLRLDEFHGELEPFSLAIRRIALNGVYSRIAILRDGTLNLQHLGERSASGPATAPASVKAGPRHDDSVQAAVASTSTEPAGGKASHRKQNRRISIGDIIIQEGTLAFFDNHLPQYFATTFYNLDGRVSGMSSENARFADVNLRGNLENRSPIQITGTINPLRDDLFVDLRIAFRDIELPPATPYSSAYLGYAIEKGKLYLDLKYHIEHKELVSENKIFVDQLTFGNRVESRETTNLPVLLGLALLKDGNGEIHLNVPVTGRTDDPEFNIWRLAFQAFRNVLAKAVSSPLSLLSSLFGEGADLSVIEFGHGTSTLASGETRKLDALARALAGRPALKIELRGYVDRVRDVAGYRAELLNHDSDFQSLARERSEAVLNYLVNRRGIAAERIFLKKDDIYKGPETGAQTGSRVELHAIAP